MEDHLNFNFEAIGANRGNLSRRWASGGAQVPAEGTAFVGVYGRAKPPSCFKRHLHNTRPA